MIIDFLDSFTTCLIRQIPLIPGLAHCVDKYKIYVSFFSNFTNNVVHFVLQRQFLFLFDKQSLCSLYSTSLYILTFTRCFVQLSCSMFISNKGQIKRTRWTWPFLRYTCIYLLYLKSSIYLHCIQKNIQALKLKYLDYGFTM